MYLSVALNTLIIHMYKKRLLIRISKVKMYACFRIIQEDLALISNNYVELVMLNSETYFPILCNQENFLLYGNRFKVKQCLPHARIIFKEALKELNEGRPKNGMFIAIPGEIKECVKDVSPNHRRVQAVILKTKKSKLLVIHTYFPTDPKLKDFDTEELLTTLAAIKKTREK